MERTEVIDSLRTTFPTTTDASLAELADALSTTQLRADEVLFEEGSTGQALYIVKTGSIKVFTRNALGEVTILQHFGPGAHFGEMALIDRHPRSATAMAVSDTTLFVLEREEFLAVLSHHPPLALDMLQQLAGRLRTTTAYVHKTNQSTAAVNDPKSSGVQQQGRVFISYSRKDGTFVRDLLTALGRSGIATVVDWRSVPAAADWWVEIEGAIQGIDSFVFVISPDSLVSTTCRREIDTAAGYNKRFIPILHRDFPSDLQVAGLIARYNWLMMRTDEEMARALPDLVRTINTDLDVVQLHTRLLARAIEWDRNGRDASFTLRGRELDRAERWLVDVAAGADPRPTRLHVEYIHAARPGTSG